MTQDHGPNAAFCVSSWQGLTLRLMDSSEIKVEMEEVGLLEPLIIIEEGDVIQGVPERGAVSSSAAGAQSCSGESVLKEEEEKHAREYKNEDNVAAKLCLEPQRLDKQEADAKDELTGGVNEEDKQEKDKPDESMNGGQNRGAAEREEQTNEEMRITEIPEKPCVTEDEEVTKNDPEVDTDRLNSAEQQAEGTETQEEDPKKVCGLFYFTFSISPEIIWTHLAVHAVNKVFVCSVHDLTKQPPCTLQEKQSRDGKTAGFILLQSLREYVGVEQILLPCQQTACAIQ